MGTEKKYIDEIHEQVKKYIIEEKDEALYNTGQLHFLKGLFIHNFTIASPVRVKKQENILNHLDKMILYETTDGHSCSLFDKEANLKSFIRSPYCDSIPEHISVQARQEDRYLPFLLIQKTQAEMERALVHYLSCQINETKHLKKNKDFLELLYSTALYEIFLREFEESLCHEYLYADFKLNSEQIQAFLQDGAYRNWHMDMRIRVETIERGWQSLFYGQCVMYYASHMLNLFAMFRVLMFVEYISLNEVRGFRRGAAQNFWFEAAIWKNLALEWEEKDLFLPLKNNRNLHVLQDQLNLICLKYNIFPHLEQDGEQSFKKDADAFQIDLMQYFQAAKERCRLNASGRSKSVMADLWGEAEKLALPVLNAKEELLTIQKPKAKSAENIRISKKG